MYTLTKPKPSAEVEQPRAKSLKAHRALLELIRSMSDKPQFADLRDALIVVGEAIVEVSEVSVRRGEELEHLRSHVILVENDCEKADCAYNFPTRKRLDA